VPDVERSCLASSIKLHLVPRAQIFLWGKNEYHLGSIVVLTLVPAEDFVMHACYKALVLEFVCKYNHCKYKKDGSYRGVNRPDRNSSTESEMQELVDDR